jgi:hypothetical protein
MIKGFIIGLLLALTLTLCSADDRKCKREHREHHNYILERQEAGVVQGVPTSRRIIGKREIDVYSDGSAYEGNGYVGNVYRH